MRLYLVRHGEPRSEAEDPERSLSVKGEEEVRTAATFAKGLDVRPSRIYHSGKRRAEQTAAILGITLKRPAEAAEGLSPNDDVHAWIKRISREKEDLMLVSHLPFLEKLAGVLITGHGKARPVSFSCGVIVCLDREKEGDWRVQWVLTPEMASVAGG